MQKLVLCFFQFHGANLVIIIVLSIITESLFINSLTC
jgi:hypothetical protein